MSAVHIRKLIPPNPAPSQHSNCPLLTNDAMAWMDGRRLAAFVYLISICLFTFSLIFIFYFWKPLYRMDGQGVEGFFALC